MIRKRVGDEFWLIPQPAHAALAGELAAAVGNRHFAKASSAAVIDAVARHDDGWAGPDGFPTLDPAGLPLHFADAPRGVAHAAWMASAAAAGSRGDYPALLVTLHQLSLSAAAAGAAASDRLDDEHRRRQFDLNKVQHALIERAETLRERLGLPVDRPLRLGLSEGWSSEAEEILRFDLRLLQACDALSLHLCCDHVPGDLAVQPQPRPYAAPVTLALRHGGDGVLRVKPWPFTLDALRATVPYRAVPATRSDDADRFREAFAAAPERAATVELRPA